MTLKMFTMSSIRGLFIFVSVGTTSLAYAEPKHNANQPASPAGSAAPAGASGLGDEFFKQFETMSTQRSACMGGEKFTQTVQGKSHQRSVSKMSNGYFYGMMTTFAEQVCEQKNKSNGGADKPSLSKAGPVGQLDALSLYQGLKPENDPLIQNYSLLLSLGMIESSGQYNEGRDKSASNLTGDTAEAGLFQVSFNSTRLSSELMSHYQALKTKYEGGKSSKCMTGIYGINQQLSKNTESFGSGEALQFQNMMKSCPAMATEYMSLLLRTNYKHNGPLRRREAQPREACTEILNKVKELATTNCDENNSKMNDLASNFAKDSRLKDKFAVAGPVDRGDLSQYLPKGEKPRGTASLARNAERMAAEKTSLEEEKKALIEAGKTEEAAELQKQISALDSSLKGISEDPSVTSAQLKIAEESIAKAEEKLKGLDAEAKAEEEKLLAEVKTLRADAEKISDPKEKERLTKLADEKENLAKESAAQSAKFKEQLTKEVETAKKKVEDSKKGAEKSTELKKIDDEVKSIEAKIKELGDKPENKAEVDKLKEKLAELNKKKAALAAPKN